MKKIFVLVAFAMSLGCMAQTNITEVWVSPSGADVSNVTGSKEAPFATLKQALLYVRQLRQQKSPEELGEVHIVLRGGVYKLAGSPPKYSKRKLSKQHQLSYFNVELISPMRSDLLVTSAFSVFQYASFSKHTDAAYILLA